MDASSFVELLHYGTPFVVSLYYLVATAIGTCTLRTSVDGGRNPRATVLGLMFAVMLTYVRPSKLYKYCWIVADGIRSVKTVSS